MKAIVTALLLTIFASGCAHKAARTEKTKDTDSCVFGSELPLCHDQVWEITHRCRKYKADFSDGKPFEIAYCKDR